MRRFELVDGTANKFWEIAVDGPDVTVRFGRIGTIGQTKTKAAASPAAAKAAHDKQIAEKLAKGYVEKTSSAVPAVAPKSAATLVDRLDAWMRANRPGLAAANGATAAQLATLDKRVPPTLKALLAWRDGTDDRLEGNYSLKSVESINESRTILDELLHAGEFDDPMWWSKSWVPFLENGGGDCVCIDLGGAFGGTRGQVLEFWHADSDRTIIYPSIDAWLEVFVTLLERGAYTLNREGFFEPDAGAFAEVRATVCPGYPKAHDASEANVTASAKATAKAAADEETLAYFESAPLAAATEVVGAMTTSVATRLCKRWCEIMGVPASAAISSADGFHVVDGTRELELDAANRVLRASWDLRAASTPSLADTRDPVFIELLAAENVKLAATQPYATLVVRTTRARLAARDSRLTYVLVRAFGDPSTTDSDFDVDLRSVIRGYLGDWAVKFAASLKAKRAQR